MKKVLFLLFTLSMTCGMFAADMVSPNAKLKVVAEGQGCKVYYQQQQVLDIPVLGNGSSQIMKVGKARHITADYQMLTGKRLHCTNEANEYQLTLGKDTRLVMRLYNDGVAFRYEGLSDKEKTAYKIPQGTKRWMQKWTDSYEGFFPQTTKATDGRWGYPALLEPADGVFVLLSEANICKGQAGSSLHSKGDLYQVVPDGNQPSAISHLPGVSPSSVLWLMWWSQR